MTTLILMLTLQDPHDAKPDPTRSSRSEFDYKITTSRSFEDCHLNFRSCMGRSCAANDKPMQKCFYLRISRFWCTFVPENSAAEDLAARMCKRGPKLTAICHMPNHPTLHRVLWQYLQLSCILCFIQKSFNVYRLLIDFPDGLRFNIWKK